MNPMSKVDMAIQWVEENMIMLYSICTKDEQKHDFPSYIIKILKKHKREIEQREENKP